mmetsp:Transcript_39545/g.92410  ORF Transcript_39545/g.92410 Transcript_39545/m.92410 type:complete len:1168 (-) Transcript_39545:38-3541(-)
MARTPIIAKNVRSKEGKLVEGDDGITEANRASDNQKRPNESHILKSRPPTAAVNRIKNIVPQATKKETKVITKTALLGRRKIKQPDPVSKQLPQFPELPKEQYHPVFVGQKKNLFTPSDVEEDLDMESVKTKVRPLKRKVVHKIEESEDEVTKSDRGSDPLVDMKIVGDQVIEFSSDQDDQMLVSAQGNEGVVHSVELNEYSALTQNMEELKNEYRDLIHGHGHLDLKTMLDKDPHHIPSSSYGTKSQGKPLLVSLVHRVDPNVLEELRKLDKLRKESRSGNNNLLDSSLQIGDISTYDGVTREPVDSVKFTQADKLEKGITDDEREIERERIPNKFSGEGRNEKVTPEVQLLNDSNFGKSSEYKDNEGEEEMVGIVENLSDESVTERKESEVDIGAVKPKPDNFSGEGRNEKVTPEVQLLNDNKFEKSSKYEDSEEEEEMVGFVENVSDESVTERKESDVDIGVVNPKVRPLKQKPVHLKGGSKDRTTRRGKAPHAIPSTVGKRKVAPKVGRIRKQQMKVNEKTIESSDPLVIINHGKDHEVIEIPSDIYGKAAVNTNEYLGNFEKNNIYMDKESEGTTNEGAETRPKSIQVFGIGIYVIDVPVIDEERSQFHAEVAIHIRKYEHEFSNFTEATSVTTRDSNKSDEVFCKTSDSSEDGLLSEGWVYLNDITPDQVTNLSILRSLNGFEIQDVKGVWRKEGDDLDYIKIAATWQFYPEWSQFPFHKNVLPLAFEVMPDDDEQINAVCFLKELSGIYPNFHVEKLSHRSVSSPKSILETSLNEGLGSFHAAHYARDMNMSNQLIFSLDANYSIWSSSLLILPCLCLAAGLLVIDHAISASAFKDRLLAFSFAFLSAIFLHIVSRHGVPAGVFSTKIDTIMTVTYISIFLSMLNAVLRGILMKFKKTSYLQVQSCTQFLGPCSLIFMMNTFLAFQTVSLIFLAVFCTLVHNKMCGTSLLWYMVLPPELYAKKKWELDRSEHPNEGDWLTWTTHQFLMWISHHPDEEIRNMLVYLENERLDGKTLSRISVDELRSFGLPYGDAFHMKEAIYKLMMQEEKQGGELAPHTLDEKIGSTSYVGVSSHNKIEAAKSSPSEKQCPPLCDEFDDSTIIGRELVKDYSKSSIDSSDIIATDPSKLSRSTKSAVATLYEPIPMDDSGDSDDAELDNFI